MLKHFDTKLFSCVAIETVNHCNRKCYFCKFGQNIKEKVQAMDWKLIEKIVFNLVELDFQGRVSWFKINEPMLDKRIFDIIKFTKNNLPRCYCSLVSNGDYIDRYCYERLVDSGLDKLGVSIYDDATWEKIKKINCEVGGKIKLLDRRSFADYAFDNRGGNVTLNKLVTIGHSNSNCERPSTMLNVDVNGDVVLCCVDFYKDVVMGNLNEEKLEEVWYNKIFDKYRKRLRRCGRIGLKLCHGCDFCGKGHQVYYP